MTRRNWKSEEELDRLMKKGKQMVCENIEPWPSITSVLQEYHCLGIVGSY